MPFRFIAGPDDFLVQRSARSEWETMAATVEDPHSREIIDGKAGNVGEVENAVNQCTSAIRTVSLFSPHKAIWFKDITFLADSQTGRAEATTKAVERLQHTLANYDDASVAVLLSASPVDRRKKAYKWFQKNGQASFIDGARDPAEVARLAVAEAEAAGHRFVDRAEHLLVEKTGLKVRVVLKETQKLATYLGASPGTITPRLVTEMVANSAQSDFFEAAEAFYSLDLEHTLDAIQRHFFSGIDARPLLTSLQNRNRLMLQLKAVQARGFLSGRITQNAVDKAAATVGHPFAGSSRKISTNLFSQSPFYLYRLNDSLHRLSLRHLMDFQDAFRHAFIRCVQYPNEQEGVLRSTAISCLTPLQASA